MCGEHTAVQRAINAGVGSSPHVRGAQIQARLDVLAPGIIPACAGSTDVATTYGPSIEGSSPHVRGALVIENLHIVDSGIIPACAGSTRSFIRDMFSSRGSSPHVRGALVSFLAL